MKFLKFIIIAIFFIITACKEAPKHAGEQAQNKEMQSDSAAIADCIHGFYKYYNAEFTDSTRLHASSFLDNSGAHMKLKMDKMKEYFGGFFKTGYISEEFIENEYKFYTTCEKIWQNEKPVEVNTGLDADKYLCSQDGEPEEFTTAPVKVDINGDRAKAKLLFKPNSPNGESRDYELKKEYGIWRLTKVVCDMGVTVN